MDAILGVDDAEKRERHRGESEEELGGSIHDSQTAGPRSGTSRMGQIDLKDPSHTYNASIRVAAEEERVAQNLQDSLNQLSGKFYTIDGNYLGRSESEYKRMLQHKITYSNGWEMMTRRKPILVANIDELSNFITVPSIDALPKASRGGTGGRPAAQAPLTSPNEEVFTEFSHGMSIGHAVTELRDKQIDYDNFEDTKIESKRAWMEDRQRRDTISLSADHLTHHYIRAATTGSGKSVSTVNDMLSAHLDLEGPTILIDPKDGDMCENYMRSHRAIVGNSDDIEYMKIPEEDGTVPGIPFFDLRPLIRGADRERTTAVQDIIDHYFQLLRFALGRDTVEQAFVANEILTNLIKALFDEQQGTDYFAIGDLLEAAQNFQHYGRHVTNAEEDVENVRKALPPVSDEDIEDILKSHLEKEERQFLNTTDAVLNRIRKLKERDFIWDMLSFKVEEELWDDKNDWYDRSKVPMLDLKNILNSNRVMLLDTGELRDESSELFSVLFLSHLWTSVQSLWTPDKENYIANIVVEESASIARNEIVYRELLPKGREFNLSLGLVMQYPEQVLGDDPKANSRAYKEILNNVNTKIIGNIATDENLAESLFHEDLDTEEIKDRIAGLRQGEWVVQLPSTGFDKQKPEILTLKPLPIPPGHNAGPFEVTSKADAIRERSRRLHCVGKGDNCTKEIGDEKFKFIGRVFGYDDDTGERYRTHVEEVNADDEDETSGSEDESTSEEDIDVDEIDLDYKQKGFIDYCIQMLTNGVEGKNLGESMTNHMHSEVASDLVENGFLEKVTLAQNKVYYYPTKKGEMAVETPMSPDEKGELGDESPEHRIGVRMATTYYEQLGYDVEMYASPPGSENKLDAIAEPTEESPDDNRKLIEVEMSPEKKGHVEGDYRTIASNRGDGVWVVKNIEGTKDLVSSLSERINEPDTRSENFEKISEQLNNPGINEILGLNQLRREIA